jgi:hypothetical protein
MIFSVQTRLPFGSAERKSLGLGRITRNQPQGTGLLSFESFTDPNALWDPLRTLASGFWLRLNSGLLTWELAAWC